MRKFWIGSLILLIAFCVGCLKKVNNAQVTPWERVHADNALFAESNLALQKGVIAVQTSGLITVNQAEPAIRFTGKTGQLHKEITAILAKGPDVSTADLATINSLVDQIEASADNAVRSGALGVKNPNTQQTVENDIKAGAALARVLLVDIQMVINARKPQAALYMNLEWRFA